MAKSGTLGMGLHQALSFSPVFMKLSRTEAVFWPGCALMNLDPVILQKTAAVLRREEQGLGICTCCCGQPTRYLFPQKYESRQGLLADKLKNAGVRRIYTACPNCQLQLQGLENMEIIPIWPVLARHLQPQDLEGKWLEEITLHDPCPMRKDAESRAAVRQLLTAAGLTIQEPAHNGENSLCCGNIQMLRARDPEKSSILRKKRVSEFNAQTCVTSPCEGCLDAFRSEGLQTAHVLELLFGKSPCRGWGNRFAFARQIKEG